MNPQTGPQPAPPDAQSPISNHRSPLARLAAPLRWFAGRSRVTKAGLVVLVVAAAAGAILARSYFRKQAADREAAAAWRDYEDAARKTDLDAMRAALDRIHAANPSDPTAPRYRAVIDRGEADPDTPELAVVLLAHHVGADRLPEAAREAKKVLAKYPKDWHAHCVLAHHALQIGRDPALAERTLEQLPDPEDPAARVSPGGLLYALRLSGLVGRDAAPLRRLIVRRLVPALRTATAAGAPPSMKAQLLACYLEPFADPAAVGELAGFWAAADKLAEDAVNEAAASADVPALTQLAELGPRMRLALAALRADDPNRFPDDRFAALLKAIDDRTRRAWEAVRAKAPDRSESYRGLALLESDPAKVVRLLLDGLAACGDRPELIEPLLAVVARHGTDDSVRSIADALLRSAADAKTDPAKWCLAAVAWDIIDRRDVALAACREARAIAPGHPWACATEARLWVRAGEFFRASEALAPLGEAVYAVPALARLRGRIMVALGQWALRDDEFRKVTGAKSRAKNSAPAVAFLLGVFDAPADADRAAWVAAKAEVVQAADPDAPLAGRLRAEALYRLAELSAATNPKGAALPPAWDANKVAAALRAFEQLPSDSRAEPAVVAAVAALQLKGQGEPAAALRIATPLLAVEPSLGPAQLEVLGAVLAANDRPANAVRVLERAVHFPRPSAGCRVALAVAYQKAARPVEARAELARAEATPDRSAREQAELVAAKILLQRENP